MIPQVISPVSILVLFFVHVPHIQVDTAEMNVVSSQNTNIEVLRLLFP
jgi:hypothetical protein